jgi:hypothetical protein
VSLAPIAGYRIERVPGTYFTSNGTGTTFVDNGLPSGTAYFYRVRAIDSNDAMSDPSSYDVATLFDFTDDPVTAHSTRIKGIHIGDLRHAIDAVRQAAGLPAAWTNYNAQSGTVKASQFLELRDKLNEARESMDVPDVQLSDAVTKGATVRAHTVLELRNGVN